MAAPAADERVDRATRSRLLVSRKAGELIARHIPSDEPAAGTGGVNLPQETRDIQKVVGRHGLQERARLFESQPRQPRPELRPIATADVAEKVRPEVSLREDLLIEAGRRLPRREEFSIDLRIVEPGHRSAVEPERAGGDDEVGALQAGVAARRRLDQRR